MQIAKKVIGSEIESFNQYFIEIFKSHVPLLNSILTYLAKQKGKQVRPMLVLLCGRLGGIINEQTYRAALFVEMLHTSSLVHDDLIDESLARRNSFSINALWKNRTAVLTGDNLFTRSILLLLSNKDYHILKIYSDSIRKVIEGELLQMDKSRKLNLDEAIYFEIIKGKTATLLAAACAAGAATTFKDDTAIQKLYLFGEKIGIAFQIKDDLLDYSDTDIGKPTGNDIKEKKVTLPLLYTLNNCNPSLRTKLINIVKYKNSDKNSVAYLVATVRNNGGIAYAEEKMLSFREEALNLLYYFPPSDIRSGLEELVRYTTERAN